MILLIFIKGWLSWSSSSYLIFSTFGNVASSMARTMSSVAGTIGRSDGSAASRLASSESRKGGTLAQRQQQQHVDERAFTLTDL